jgi:hypothetical protein
LIADGIKYEYSSKTFDNSLGFRYLVDGVVALMTMKEIVVESLIMTENLIGTMMFFHGMFDSIGFFGCGCIGELVLFEFN